MPGFSQKVTISITEGKISPNVLKHTAPISDIKGPKFGMAAAITTVRIWKRNEFQMVTIQYGLQKVKVG